MPTLKAWNLKKVCCTLQCPANFFYLEPLKIRVRITFAGALDSSKCRYMIKYYIWFVGAMLERTNVMASFVLMLVYLKRRELSLVQLIL